MSQPPVDIGRTKRARAGQFMAKALAISLARNRRYYISARQVILLVIPPRPLVRFGASSRRFQLRTTLILAALVLTASFATADDPKPKLQPADAQKIALHSAKGTIENQDSIVANGRTNYSFDIKTGKDIRVVVVDGDTGKIVSNNTETPDELAAKKKKKRPGMTLQGVDANGVSVH